MLKKFHICLLLVACYLSLSVDLVYAQFGKNQVRKENWTWQYYATEHFEVYHYLDLKDPWQDNLFKDVIGQLEMSYKELSDFYKFRTSESIPVIMHKRLFDTDKVLGVPFWPEGIAGVTESGRDRLILRLDLPPSLLRQTITHESDHVIYFKQVRRKLSLLGMGERPLFFFEGSRAIYVSNLIEPATRDEILTIKVRKMVANTTAHLPTFEMMENQACYPGKICDYYTYGYMVSKFLEKTYGSGFLKNVENSVKKFLHDGTFDSKKSIFEVLNSAVGNKWNSSEEFDEEFSAFWQKYYKNLLGKDKLNADTGNYSGRLIWPSVKESITSPALSPDGKEVAFFEVGPYGVSIGKAKLDDSRTYEKVFESFPPIPFEVCIAQEFLTWPFDGYDLDWSQDNRLAFFCNSGDDRPLVIFDVATKLWKRYELNLDQPFSPAFSPDGRLVYFAATKNTVRDIYLIELESGRVKNLTNDPQFDASPNVAPDGKSLVYVSHDHDFQKLFRLDINFGLKTQLTFNRYNDSTPSFIDQSHILYRSDEINYLNLAQGQEDRVWNLYTMDLETGQVSQWTDIYAGVFTPRALKNSKDIVAVVSWADRQFGGVQLPVDMIYELKLKQPIRTFTMADLGQTMDYAFRTHELFRYDLDPNQLNSKNFHRNWQMRSNGFNFGGVASGGFTGFWSSATVEVSDILEEKRYSFVGFFGGLRYFDFNHLDLSKRMYRGYNVHYETLPLYYRHYELFKGGPKQPALHEVFYSATTATYSLLYPINKFNRFEFDFGLDKRSYTFAGLSKEEAAIDLANRYPDSANRDLAFYKFFIDSGGANGIVSAAYVRDTVVSTGNVLGIYHGNLLRTKVKALPSISGDRSNISVSIDARSYRGLGSRSLLATRCQLVYNLNVDGKYVLLGGVETLRGYPYASIAGNNISYCSGELRFPLVDSIDFPGRVALRSIRGLLFADGGISKFSNSNISAIRAYSYGLGVQLHTFTLPLNFIWARTSQSGRRFDYYMRYNW